VPVCDERTKERVERSGAVAGSVGVAGRRLGRGGIGQGLLVGSRGGEAATGLSCKSVDVWGMAQGMHDAALEVVHGAGETPVKTSDLRGAVIERTRWRGKRKWAFTGGLGWRIREWMTVDNIAA
jgi:hypothetical protein